MLVLFVGFATAAIAVFPRRSPLANPPMFSAFVQSNVPVGSIQLLVQPISPGVFELVRATIGAHCSQIKSVYI